MQIMESRLTVFLEAAVDDGLDGAIGEAAALMFNLIVRLLPRLLWTKVGESRTFEARTCIIFLIKCCQKQKSITRPPIVL